MGMVQHLELHYLGNQITSDEKLLSTYPAAIRRRVLRCDASKDRANQSIKLLLWQQR